MNGLKDVETMLVMVGFSSTCRVTNMDVDLIQIIVFNYYNFLS